MRVLHLYRTYFPETQGGLQESIRQLCLATRPFGIDNTIFALARDPVPAELALPEAHLVRARSWFELASCDFGAWDALHRCRKEADRCDIIQVHYPWPFADMMLPYIRRRKQPVVVTYVSDIVRQNGSGLGQLYAPLRRYLLGSATRIVASTPNYAHSSQVLQAYKAKLACVPHCLQDAPKPDPTLVARWSARFGDRFFLFIGVLRYYKGLNFLLEAASSVAAPILILGEGPEGAGLKREVELKKLGNVHFLGALPDVDKDALMSICRGVVFPSHVRSEAFGMVLLEGARAAKPLICCEIGTGTTWINRHNETGLVVAPEDPGALAAAMNALSGDDALCKRLGDGARRRWDSHFTPQAVGAAYRQIYEDVLRLGPHCDRFGQTS